MSEWNFIDFGSKDNLLARSASSPTRCWRWRRSRACGRRRPRPATGRFVTSVGHLVDTTEGYFAGMGRRAQRWHRARRARREGHERARRQGRASRSVGRAAGRVAPRLEKDRAEMLAIMEGLDADRGAASWCRTSTWARCRRSSTRWRNSSTTRCTPGTSAKVRGARTRWMGMPPTYSCRSASSCGSRRPTARRRAVQARSCGSPATTAATTRVSVHRRRHRLRAR